MDGYLYRAMSPSDLERDPNNLIPDPKNAQDGIAATWWTTSKDDAQTMAKSYKKNGAIVVRIPIDSMKGEVAVRNATPAGNLDHIWIGIQEPIPLKELRRVRENTTLSGGGKDAGSLQAGGEHRPEVGPRHGENLLPRPSAEPRGIPANGEPPVLPEANAEGAGRNKGGVPKNAIPGETAGIPNRQARPRVTGEKTEGPTVLRTRATGKVAGRGISIEKAEAAIAPLRAQFPADVEVKNSTDLQDNVKPWIDEDVTGYYDPAAKKVVILADRLPDEREAVRTYLHEIVGHHGISTLLGDRADRYYSSIYKSKKAAVDKIADKYDLDVADEAERHQAVEEYLAELAENPQEHQTILRRLYAEIRMALRKIMPDLKWTDEEINELIRRGGQKAKEDLYLQQEGYNGVQDQQGAGKAGVQAGRGESRPELRVEEWKQKSLFETKALVQKSFPEAHPEDVKNTEEVVESAAKAALDTLPKNSDDNVVSRALRIAKHFAETGRHSIIGETVNDDSRGADLAAIAQIYRNTKIETFRVAFVKDNTVVAENAVSSDGVNSGRVYPERRA